MAIFLLQKEPKYVHFHLVNMLVVSFDFKPRLHMT